MSLDLLTSKQREVADNILEEINLVLLNALDGRRMFSLQGSAGVGKTFLTGVLVEEFKKIRMFDKRLNIMSTTPTHKALAVLRDMIDDDNIPSKTIHSYLNLKLKKNYQTGKNELVQESSKEVDNIDILIVDESSMVSKELFDIIKANVDRRKIKCVLYIGDFYQLPPVSDIEGEYNPIYNQKNPYQLDEIVRQAKDSSIIQLAQFLRQRIELQDFLSLDELSSKIKSIKGINEIQVFNNFNQWFEIYNDKKDTDSLICAYKNDTVTMYNNIARTIHKGENLPYLLKDEYLVFLEAHSEDDELIHMNNETIQIKDCKKDFDEDRKIEYWSVLDYENKLFKVVDPVSLSDWNSRLNTMSKIASSAKSQDRGALWKHYFMEKEEFQKVARTYSSTIHKSQGSSVTNVFIDLNELIDAGRYSSLDTIYRLLYVGITRAKENLYLYIK